MNEKKKETYVAEIRLNGFEVVVRLIVRRSAITRREEKHNTFDAEEIRRFTAL